MTLNRREFKIILKRCNDKCPHYEYHDGGGMCDEWTSCNVNIHRKLEIEPWNLTEDGQFPSTCPLKKI